MFPRTWSIGVAAVAGMAWVMAAHAEERFTGDVVRIGVLGDLSGIYADLSGLGSVEAAKMAVEDFGGTVVDKKIEVISADMQNKPDVAAVTAREWYDSGVDLILEGGNSAGALAVAALSTEKKKMYMPSAPGTTALTNESCGPYIVHYTYDTFALANVAARAFLKQGKKDWFFITTDYAFGHSLQGNAARILEANGGKVVGSVLHPVGTTEFSSYVLQAQSSRAPVVALATGAQDTQNILKAAAEFGALQNQEFLALIMFVTDVHAMGIENVQGMLFTSAWYWDLNDATRAFSKRFFDRHGKMPTSAQAGNYSAVLTYLNAVRAAGTDDADAVMAEMRKMRINDMFAENGYVRKDGRFIHDMYLVQVKRPKDSKYPWDYFNVIEKISGDDAFQPLSESKCPLVKG
ncbi:ABC transporter substrate-binding protein [Rhodoligotrophos defluvii]|uniref:ABC transporter substrate-binding protein n=1 Tax=Rhodoligotrophos defluvii TaxID=2561934 RepID=UPI0010C94FEA|nr:ABC transporter substrate-binding protein [Rhodoligotrophos defluvii]